VALAVNVWTPTTFVVTVQEAPWVRPAGIDPSVRGFAPDTIDTPGGRFRVTVAVASYDERFVALARKLEFAIADL